MTSSSADVGAVRGWSLPHILVMASLVLLPQRSAAEGRQASALLVEHHQTLLQMLPGEPLTVISLVPVDFPPEFLRDLAHELDVNYFPGRYDRPWKLLRTQRIPWAQGDIQALSLFRLGKSTGFLVNSSGGKVTGVATTRTPGGKTLSRTVGDLWAVEIHGLTLLGSRQLVTSIVDSQPSNSGEAVATHLKLLNALGPASLLVTFVPTSGGRRAQVRYPPAEGIEVFAAGMGLTAEGRLEVLAKVSEEAQRELASRFRAFVKEGSSWQRQPEETHGPTGPFTPEYRRGYTKGVLEATRVGDRDGLFLLSVESTLDEVAPPTFELVKFVDNVPFFKLLERPHYRAALDYLRRVVRISQNYVGSPRMDHQTVEMMECSFPPAMAADEDVGKCLTPEGEVGKDCPSVAQTFSHPTWGRLAREIAEELRLVFSYQSSGTLEKAMFTARLEGYLPGETQMTVFEISGRCERENYLCKGIIGEHEITPYVP